MKKLKRSALLLTQLKCWKKKRHNADQSGDALGKGIPENGMVFMDRIFVS
jgi:hypothetical protein